MTTETTPNDAHNDAPDAGQAEHAAAGTAPAEAAGLAGSTDTGTATAADTSTRRGADGVRLARRIAIPAGAAVAAVYVKPGMRSLGVPAVRAQGSGPVPTTTPTDPPRRGGLASLDLVDLTFGRSGGDLAGSFRIQNTSEVTANITSITIEVRRVLSGGNVSGDLAVGYTTSPTAPLAIGPSGSQSFTFTADTNPDIVAGDEYKVTVNAAVAPPSSKPVYSLTESKVV